ncbi:MAG: MFS transporter [Opitutales bacterium]|nr:MFS transporter [Opitutales bacterium]
MELSPKARLTFRCDLFRGASQGILETGFQTIALIILVRYFEASATEKSILAGANAYGMLLSPFVLHYISRLGWAPSRLASWFFLSTGAVLLLTLVTTNSLLFLLSIILAAVLLNQNQPQMVQIYAENYDRRRRGSMLSNSIFLSVIVAMIYSAAAGRILDFDLALYRLPLMVMVAACVATYFALRRIPSTPGLLPPRRRNPLNNLSLVWSDRTFGGMLLIWMFMGIGNLMVLPLRVEYMANPLYGINASNTQIALMTVILPAAGRLLTTHLWGYIFDRLNFAKVRTILNSFFLVSILLFFFTDDLWVMGLASGLFGIAMGGGGIAWNLWVTKIAPEEKTSAYMSIHVFFTGIRGVLAPFLGFYLLTFLSPQTVSLVAAFFISISIFSLVPFIRKFSR